MKLNTFTAYLLLVVIVGHGVLLCQAKASKTKTRAVKPEPPGDLYAACEVKPSTHLPQGYPAIYGQVLFKQSHRGGPLRIMLDLHGLPVQDTVEHGIHIHQHGDVGDGCRAAGPHFNPEGVNHPSHAGDLGSHGSSHGRIRVLLRAKAALLRGDHSVLGRAVVIHEKVDDMGLGGNEASRQGGNAGRRIACCVIEVCADSTLWDATVEPILEESSEE